MVRKVIGRKVKGFSLSIKLLTRYFIESLRFKDYILDGRSSGIFDIRDLEGRNVNKGSIGYFSYT